MEAVVVGGADGGVGYPAAGYRARSWARQLMRKRPAVGLYHPHHCAHPYRPTRPLQDCEILDLAGRPEDLLMTHLPVPPVCIRPRYVPTAPPLLHCRAPAACHARQSPSSALLAKRRVACRLPLRPTARPAPQPLPTPPSLAHPPLPTCRSAAWRWMRGLVRMRTT